MKPWLSSQLAGDQNGCGGWSKGDRYCHQQVFNKAQNPFMVWTTEPSSLCGSEIVIENWSKKYGSENHNILQTVGLGTALDRTLWGSEADEGTKKQITFLMKKEIKKFLLPGSMWFSSHEVNLGYWRAWQHDQCLQGVLITLYWLHGIGYLLPL